MTEKSNMRSMIRNNTHSFLIMFGEISSCPWPSEFDVLAMFMGISSWLESDILTRSANNEKK